MLLCEVPHGIQAGIHCLMQPDQWPHQGSVCMQPAAPGCARIISNVRSCLICSQNGVCVSGAEFSLHDMREGEVWLVGFEERAWPSRPSLKDVPAGSAMKQAAHW